MLMLMMGGEMGEMGDGTFLAHLPGRRWETEDKFSDELDAYI